MTAGLETFAKVRALHDRTDHPGEKVAAAGRMEALARTAGMTVAEALSKLDAAPPQSDLAAAARAWADRYEAAAEAAAKAADAPEASSRLWGLPIYDPNKIEPWRNVAEHCLMLDWITPKAHGGRFLTKAERGRLKGVARHYGSITNATADWIKTVLAQCEAARQSWRDRGKAGVRPDRKATESDIEKAAELVAAAKRREASKLDTSASKSRAQATADAFNNFFNTPEMRAQFARQDAERQVRRAQILAEFGSVEAVYAETSREAALRGACTLFTVWDRQPGCAPTYTLSGWKWPDSDEKIPAPVLDAVKRGWPMPNTVKEAWAEYDACEKLARKRHTMHDYEYWPELWVNVRNGILKTLLATLPAASIGDMLARQSWIEADLEYGVVNQTVCATLRADIERMGARLKEESAPVQSGQGEGVSPRSGENLPTSQVSRSPVSGTENDPPDLGHQGTPPPSGVQNGQPGCSARTAPHRRTNADKRRDVLALLNAGNPGTAPLTDREIARRAGVSPQTVGNIRRSLKS